MKNAVKLPQYSDTQLFVPPAGITEVTLDKATNLIADASCPDDYTAAFLDGTQPTGTCDHPNGDQRNIFQKMFGLGEKGTSPPLISPPPTNVVQPKAPQGNNPANSQNGQQNQSEPAKKKKGFFGKIFGAFKDDKSKNQDQNQNQPPNQQPQQ
jgi:penicillin-binding protein 1B